jgi:selenocysteine-specific elongation factor
LEWHGSKVEHIVAGQRAAINLGGIDATDISRGMVLSSASRGVTSDSWDAMARWNQAVPSGMRVRVHIGTGEFLGRVYSLKDQPSHYMRLVLEKPLTAAMNDKCIIRQYSPQHLLGGMTLIAPNKQSRRMSATRLALAEAMAARRLADIVYCLIADHAEPETVDEIKRDSGYTQDRMVEDVLAKLLSERKIVSIGSYYLTTQGLEALTQKMVELVGRYHKEQANRAGLSKDILRQKLKLPERPFEVLLDYWQTHKVIALQGAEVALAGFVGNHTQWRQNMVETVESLVEDLGLTSIDSQLLLQKMKISAGEARTVIELLLREGLLVRVGELQLHQKTLANIAMMIKQHFAAHPSLTVAEFRDMLNTSRKVALPLLEFYDMKRYTLRCGEARGPGPKLQDLK